MPLAIRYKHIQCKYAINNIAGSDKKVVGCHCSASAPLVGSDALDLRVSCLSQKGRTPHS